MNRCKAPSSGRDRGSARLCNSIRVLAVVSIATGWTGFAQDAQDVSGACDSRFSSCGESRVYLDRNDRVCMLSGAVRYTPSTDPSVVELVPRDRELQSAIRIPAGVEVESLILYGDDELTQPLRVAGELVSFRPDDGVSADAALKVESAKAGFRWVGFSAALPEGGTPAEPLRFRWAYVLRGYPELASIGEHTCAVYWNGDEPGTYIAQFCRVRSDLHSSHAVGLGGAWTSAGLVTGGLVAAAFVSARWRRRRTAVAQPA